MQINPINHQQNSSYYKNFNLAKQGINFLLTVNKELEKSEQLKIAFIQGKNIPLYQVMLQSQKAKISLELLTKIRDEALKSYNYIVNIRL